MFSDNLNQLKKTAFFSKYSFEPCPKLGLVLESNMQTLNQGGGVCWGVCMSLSKKEPFLLKKKILNQNADFFLKLIRMTPPPKVAKFCCYIFARIF